MEFDRNGKLQIATGISDNNAAFLEGNTLNNYKNAMATLTLQVDATLWHRHFGHYIHAGINEEITWKLVTGLTLESKKPLDPICEPCLAGKMHANLFTMSNNHMSVPLELVHSDVHDVNHHMFTGYRNWVTFINDYPHYQFVFLIKRKSEVSQAFKNFKAYAETQLGHHIKALCDDKGANTC